MSLRLKIVTNHEFLKPKQKNLNPLLKTVEESFKQVRCYIIFLLYTTKH